MREFPLTFVRGEALVALVAGPALAALLLSDVVVATGRGGPSQPSIYDPSPTAEPALFTTPTLSPQPGDTAPRQSAGHRVCVRLCDGAFFPVASTSSANNNAKYEATCASLCPDAPTALYLEPDGSDRIEDAESTSGVSYSALPTALRFRTAHAATCTCRRSGAQQFPILLDSTLRKGDYVMTRNGLMVFTGSSHVPHTRSDFTALAEARLSQTQRAALVAMEQASLPNANSSSNTIER